MGNFPCTSVSPLSSINCGTVERVAARSTALSGLTRFSRSSRSGFCYRCVFPRPPPAESVTTCSEGGVLGPVVGAMGVLMAVETIKLLLSGTGKSTTSDQVTSKGSLLLYSAFSQLPFRTVKLKGKRNNCLACSDRPSISRQSLLSGSIDYLSFCGIRQPITLLAEDKRISPSRYNRLRIENPTGHHLIDVRESVEFELGHLSGSVNVPWSQMSADPTNLCSLLSNVIGKSESEHASIYFVCRYGNDSQLAAQLCTEPGQGKGQGRWDIKDIKGGLNAWRTEVDSDFPDY